MIDAFLQNSEHFFFVSSGFLKNRLMCCTYLYNSFSQTLANAKQKQVPVQPKFPARPSLIAKFLPCRPHVSAGGNTVLITSCSRINEVAVSTPVTGGLFPPSLGYNRLQGKVNKSRSYCQRRDAKDLGRESGKLAPNKSVDLGFALRLGSEVIEFIKSLKSDILKEG